MQEEIISDNLYQLPICTICLQQMNRDIASLNCGHTFHHECITQHFEYRSSCPYCQKRAMLKEIKPIIFPVIKNNSAMIHLNNFLANFNKDDRNQIQQFISQIKTLNQCKDKQCKTIQYLQIQGKQKDMKIDEIVLQNTQTKKLLQIVRNEFIDLDKEYKQIRKVKQEFQKENFTLFSRVQSLQQKNREFQQLKTIYKIANSCSQDLSKYKMELQASNTPPLNMSKSFFDMLQLKSLSLLKAKEKQKEFQVQVKIKQQQNNKLKEQIKHLKIKISELVGDKTKFSKKYEQLKIKFRNYIEKHKQFIGEPPYLQQQDSKSNNFSKTERILMKRQQKLNFKSVQKNKVQQKQSFGYNAIKKEGDKNTTKQLQITNFML